MSDERIVFYVLEADNVGPSAVGSDRFNIRKVYYIALVTAEKFIRVELFLEA